MQKKFFLFFLILIPHFISTQNEKKIDSLLDVYNTQAKDTSKVKTISHLFNTLLYQDINSAKKYADEELLLSKKLNFQKGIALSNYHLGVYYNNIDEIDSAKIYYTKSIKIYDNLNDNISKANVNHGFAILEYSSGNFEQALKILEKNIIFYLKKPIDSSSLALTYVLRGSIYRHQAKYKLAIKESINALKIYETLNEDIRKADALGLLATVEFSLENHQKSIEYNKQALKIYREYNDINYSAQALNDIGNCYYYLENYIEALKYLEMSLLLLKDTKSKDLLATVLGNIGKVHIKQNNLDKAITNFKRSIDLTTKSGNKYKTAESLNDLGILFNINNKPEKAIPLFNESIALSENIDAMQNLRIGYFNKSESYSILNEHKMALIEYKKFTEVSDSIFNTEKLKQIEELRTLYETEKKEQQILIQDKEIELLKQKEENNNLIRLLLGIGLLLSLMGVYAIRQKLKRSKLEKEKVDIELDFKKKELTTHVLHLAKKNEVLEGLKQKVKEFKSSENNQNGYQQLIRTINFDLKDDNNWENFSKYFQEVHKDFNSNVKQKFPEVTPNELRLMSLLKMNLTSKEIANILNISQEGIKKARYRLRKKLEIPTEDSLLEMVINL